MDNLTLPLSPGLPIAADDVGGVMYPRTKISYGVDGAAFDVTPSQRFPVSLLSETILSDGRGVTQVGTTSGKFADNFSVFDPTKWTEVRKTGFTYAVVAGELAVSTTTTSGHELLLVGAVNQTNPANLMAIVRTAARSAGLEVRIGYCEVDSNGTPIPHATLPGHFANAVWFVQGRITTATTYYLESIAVSSAIKTLTVTGQVTSVSGGEYLLELRPEDATFTSVAMDSTTIRSSAGGRLSSQLPDPNRLYRPFIWVVNTAAATATTVTLTRFLSMDVQELQAEVGGGRGNSAASQSIPVTVTGGSLSSAGGGAITGANVSAGSNSNLFLNFKSAATTNATLIKNGAGRIMGGYLVNNGAAYAFVKFHQLATAPIVGTTPVVLTIPLPPNVPLNLNELAGIYGLYLTTGISMSVTGGVADNDTTAIAANQVVGFIQYV